MPVVTVGICRNNLWSLQFTPTLQVLFASMDGIDFSSLARQIQSFDSLATIQIGPLQIEKRGISQVTVTFPGLCLTPNKWLVSESGNHHQRIIDIADADLRTLLEFLVHMREQF